MRKVEALRENLLISGITDVHEISSVPESEAPGKVLNSLRETKNEASLVRVPHGGFVGDSQQIHVHVDVFLLTPQSSDRPDVGDGLYSQLGGLLEGQLLNAVDTDDDSLLDNDGQDRQRKEEGADQAQLPVPDEPEDDGEDDARNALDHTPHPGSGGSLHLGAVSGQPGEVER